MNMYARLEPFGGEGAPASLEAMRAAVGDDHNGPVLQMPWQWGEAFVGDYRLPVLAQVCLVGKRGNQGGWGLRMFATQASERV